MGEKPKIGKQAFALLLAMAMSLATYGVCVLWGPIPVRVGLELSSFYASPYYLATIGLPFGVLVAEGLIDFRERGMSLPGLLLAASLVALGVLHGMKWFVPIPLSGHGVVLGFYLVHEMVERREGRKWKLLVGVGVLLQSAWFKLVLWSDPASLVAGLGLGMVVWSVQRLVVLRHGVR